MDSHSEHDPAQSTPQSNAEDPTQALSSSLNQSVMRLCVLDWDDTFCPSSWISTNCQPITDQDLLILRNVEEGISNLLRSIDALGCSVVIITNADEEWVRFSCARFLPRVFPLLSRVHVVSARQYEGVYPGRSVCWKAAAFTHVAKAFFLSREGSLPREIISIGDSNDERLAVRAAAAPLLATPKAIKLVDSPRLHTVACQLHTVTTCLPTIVQSNHALDVDIATILNYMHVRARTDCGLVDSDGVVNDSPDLLRRIWHDAAWGLLTAIRLQSPSRHEAKPLATPVVADSSAPRPMTELPAAA